VSENVVWPETKELVRRKDRWSRENGGTGRSKGLGTVEAGGRVADLRKENGKRLARYDGS